MDASRTWVPMARAHGAQVIERTEALQLQVRKGRVTGLLCRNIETGEPIRVRAQRYVLCGGAINTPELLLRSGVLTDRVGRRMSMNAGAMMVAEYPDPIDAYDGIQMGVYHEEDGYTIEQDHNPYLSFCMTQPIWLDRYKARRPDLYRYLTSCGVLTPTEPVGRVFLHPLRHVFRRMFHRAEVDIHLPDEDRRTMIRGYQQLARIYLASGARRVYAPTHRRVVIRKPGEVDVLEEVLSDARNISGLGSAHPHGGAAIGDSPRRDVLRPDFGVRGVANLFVMDASIFPTSMGVNPMLTIMAVADYAVQIIGDLRVPVRIEEGPAWEARRRARAIHPEDLAHAG
jgi:choline dehydrogenase-like flavoprotein